MRPREGGRRGAGGGTKRQQRVVLEPRLVAANHLFRDAHRHAAAPGPAVPARLLPTPPLLADGRTWIGGVIRLLTIVLPGFAGNWVEVYADNPFYFLLLALLIWGLLSFGRWMERALRDEARHVWQQTLGPSRSRLATRGSERSEPAPPISGPSPL